MITAGQIGSPGESIVAEYGDRRVVWWATLRPLAQLSHCLVATLASNAGRQTLNNDRRSPVGIPPTLIQGPPGSSRTLNMYSGPGAGGLRYRHSPKFDTLTVLSSLRYYGKEDNELGEFTTVPNCCRFPNCALREAARCDVHDEQTLTSKKRIL